MDASGMYYPHLVDTHFDGEIPILAAFLMRDEIQGLNLSGFGPYAHDDDIWFEPWPLRSCV